jgi:hypothetical protein
MISTSSAIFVSETNYVMLCLSLPALRLWNTSYTLQKNRHLRVHTFAYSLRTVTSQQYVSSRDRLIHVEDLTVHTWSCYRGVSLSKYFESLARSSVYY